MLDESGPFAMLGTSEIVGLTQGGQGAIVRLDHALLVVDVRALRDEPTLPGHVATSSGWPRTTAPSRRSTIQGSSPFGTPRRARSS